jgi:hypothetical protein
LPVPFFARPEDEDHAIFTSILLTLLSLLVIFLIMLDAFEAVVLPRRVTHPYRFTRLYYRTTWHFWFTISRLFRSNRYRQSFLSVYGPLSLLLLFTSWAFILIIGFGVLHYALSTASYPNGAPANFGEYLYLSGGIFFTLGFGDLVPVTTFGRVLSVVEGGLGFGFIALIIGYLPALYQAFSRREATITLFDARAGSPPTAAEFLRRLGALSHCDVLEPFLVEWEHWAGELLESHLSFPVLSFYRSQHDNQSWLAALTAVLDISAVILAAVKEGPLYQTQLTFAMARHAAVDLALVFQTPPRPPEPDRLNEAQWQRLYDQLRPWPIRDQAAALEKLTELRGLYEPFVNALAARLLLPLPPILSEKPPVDNWQTTAWARRAPGIGQLLGKVPAAEDDHFD